MPAALRLACRSLVTRSARALLITVAIPAALAAQAAAPGGTLVPAQATANGAVSPANRAAAPAPAATATASSPANAPLAAAQPVALRAKSSAPATLPNAPQDTNRGNTALVIVGAAAIVVGAVVGDDAGTVLMLGGAGIGLFGLWRLLN